jgi:hypothetical protein
MLFNERKLRIYGHLVVGAVMFTFFMLPNLITSHKFSYLFPRMIASTLLWTVTVWEPTRFIILQARKRWGAGHDAKRRIITVLLVLPATLLLGYLRNFVEHFTIAEQPLHDITFILASMGTNLQFVMAVVAVYEAIFYIEKWHNSELETRELKKMNLQMQFDSLKVQIQPHFLFNTLNTLVGLMRIDTPRAIHFTEEMAHVYRYLLDANEQQLISLEEEMKFTQAYFFLLKTRYPEGLHLEVIGEIDMESYQLPPLSLQVLIENAVKHNIITMDKPLYIKIDFQPALKQLTVCNNLQKKPQAFTSGLGLIHLKKKFELMHLPEVRVIEDTRSFSVTVPLIKSVAV